MDTTNKDNDQISGPDKQGMALWKKSLFGTLALIVFFTGLELVLAVIGVKPFLATEDPFVGFSKSVPLFIEKTRPDGQVMLQTASNKIGIFNYQEFPAKKGPDTYRIFCMGGSTTHGNPYDDQTSFCGWLREFLRSADRSKSWEVINAGGISYASYRVANLMYELSSYQPDMFIVYQGENEFLEERTYRDIIGMPSWIMGTKTVLGRTRTYNAINRAVRLVTANDAASGKKRFEMAGEVSEILNNTIGPTSYKRDDALKRQVIEHYKSALKRMITIAGSSGSRIIFITPASNLKDSSPFKSEHREGMSEAENKQWTLLFNRAVKLQDSGDQTLALELFNKALDIDDRYADLHFRRGRALYSLGRFKEAEAAFVKAKDEDICPLRILTQTSETLASVTEENKVPLLDFVKMIRDKCNMEHRHGIPGNEYFLDHLHPTIEMNRELALSLMDMLVKSGIARPSASWNENAVTAVVKKVESAIDKKKHAAALKDLAKTLDWAGKFDEAYVLFSRASSVLGNDEDFLIAFATACHRMGKSDEALQYYRRALRTNTNSIPAHRNMAEILLKKGDTKGAEQHFTQVIRIINSYDKNGRKARETDLINAHENLALLLSVQGRNREAASHHTDILALNPGYDKAHTDIGVLLVRDGRINEAVSHFNAALKANPGSSKAHYNLGKILSEQGKIEEAVVHYSEALRIDPLFAEAHNNLGVALAKQDRIKEAAIHFSEAARINPDYAEALYNLGSALSLQGKAKEAEHYFARSKKLRGK